MSDDIYDVDPKPVQSNEIGPVTHVQLHSPDAQLHAGPTYHQGVDYGQADTAVTVVDGTQCVHDGVPHYGGETLRVPKTVAEFLIRSGWAVAGSGSESGSESEPAAPAKAAPKAPAKRQVTSGSGRPSPRR